MEDVIEGPITENGIYLGDAKELLKLVPDKSIDLIVTDPPYEIEGYYQSAGLSRHREYVKQIRSMGITSGFDRGILDELLRVMKKTDIYVWCNKEQIYDYIGYFVKERGCNFEILVWRKLNPTPFTNFHYLKDKEYCLYFWETGAKLNVRYDTGATVFDTAVNQGDKDLYKHPTIKPQPIMERLISNSSDPGDVVLDPFVGSGTTCAAAKAIGRRWIGFEINPEYAEIARNRMKGVTQKEVEAGAVQLSLLD